MAQADQKAKAVKAMPQESNRPSFVHELTAIAATAAVGLLIAIIFTFLV